MSAIIGQYCVIHDGIVIPPDACIGHCSVIEEGVILNEGVRIGNHCTIEADVELPSPCTIWHWVHLRRGAKLGVNVMIGSQAYIGPGVSIGRNSRIGASAQLHEPAHIGDNVFIGPAAFLGNDKYPQVGKIFTPQPVVIGDDVVIAAKASIMGGITIGEGAIVGMSAVVIRDVPPGTVVCGNPAQVKRHRSKHYMGTNDEHWEPANPSALCIECNRRGLDQVNDEKAD